MSREEILTDTRVILLGISNIFQSKRPRDFPRLQPIFFLVFAYSFIQYRLRCIVAFFKIITARF